MNTDIKYINNFMKGIFCYDTFPYPINPSNMDLHILEKVKMKRVEVDKLSEEIDKLYEIDEFIPIIPQKGTKEYKCLYNKIFKNINKLSEIIYLTKSVGLDLDIFAFSKILKKEIDKDIEVTGEDIDEINKKIYLFTFLIYKNQREKYIREINRRKSQIEDIQNKINNRDDLVNKLKLNPSYEILKNRKEIINMSRDYFIKKITIFLVTFENELDKMDREDDILMPEVFYTIIESKYLKWDLVTNKQIDKMINYICSKLKKKLINFYYKDLAKLIVKLNKTQKLIVKFT